MITPLPVLTQVLPPNPIILRIETIEKEIAAEKQAKIDAQVAAQQALQAAEIARQAALVVAQEKATQALYVAQASCSDAKSCIYMHESGNNPKAENSIGCLGLGQACPGSKLLAVCPALDYACEDTFFTNYAINTYGSWDRAWQVWQSKSWW